MQNHGVEHRENCRVGADAQRKRKQRGRSERFLFPQQLESELQVLQHRRSLYEHYAPERPAFAKSLRGGRDTLPVDMKAALFAALFLDAGIYLVTWFRAAAKATASAVPSLIETIIGFITNFFDTLG